MNLKRVIKRILFRPEKRVLVPVKIPVFKNELLKGRRAFITGGGRGIGRAIAKAFLSSGCEVVITGRSEDLLVRTVAELSSIGPRIGYIVLDNSKPSSFSDAITASFEKYGDIDILVNNAGFTRGGDFGDVVEEGYDEVFNSILKGAYFLSQEFVARWKEKRMRANIFNVCSTSSLRPGHSPYTICKNAERAMTVGLAKRLVGYDIVVNGIGPGVTAVERLVPDIEAGIAHPKNPSGRYATEEEIANMSVILVSDLGRMSTGDILYMGGGAGVVTIDDE